MEARQDMNANFSQEDLLLIRKALAITGAIGNTLLIERGTITPAQLEFVDCTEACKLLSRMLLGDDNAYSADMRRARAYLHLFLAQTA